MSPSASVVNIPDVFIGSTDDACTFIVVNRGIPDADALMARAGFTAREHKGRTIYVLPPTTAQDAHERTGDALYEVVQHTFSFADLSWTTYWSPDSPPHPTVLRLRLGTDTAHATADTDEARSVLTQFGFTPTGDGTVYQAPEPLNEDQLLSRAISIHGTGAARGFGVRVDLGIPDLDAIPGPPRAIAPPAPSPSAAKPPRRTR